MFRAHAITERAPRERTASPHDDAAALRDALDVGELARRAAVGDMRAMTQFLRVAEPEMVRVVRGVMGPFASEVDDAVQQSLVALIESLHGYRGDGSALGYACRIACRKALAMRKRARRALARRAPSADVDLVPALDSPSGRSEARQRTELMRALLDHLPVGQAEALVMRTVLGCSIEEIAAAAGVPINTVRSRLRLAKDALRRQIENDPSMAEELGVES